MEIKKTENSYLGNTFWKINNNETNSHDMKRINQKNNLNNIPAVKLAISSEGKECWRESLWKICPESKESSIPDKFTPGIIATDFSALLCDKLTTNNSSQPFTWEEKSSDLLRAYAELYDEIVQGYESGQRETYVTDSDAENGFRKLTLSEELDCLNQTFKRFADDLEKQINDLPKFNAFFEEQLDFMIKNGNKAAQEEAKEKKEAWEYKIKNEVIPENISKKLIAAAKEFVMQYVSKNITDVTKILENIKIF